MLTTRMKKAMILILQADGYITLKDIAAELGVSTRTLLRELENLSSWTEKNDGIFVKKKGSGIKVEGNEAEKGRLLELLHQSDSDVVFSPTQRSIIIRAELLKSDEPLKLFTIANILDVVESTVSGDLLNIETWLEGYGIALIRRQGLGVYIKGDEKSIRKAAISLLYEQIPILEFMDYIRMDEENAKEFRDEIHSRINKSLFGLLDIDHIRLVAEVIEDVGRQMGYSYADNAFMALTLRFCITLKRQEHWGQQLLDYDYRETLRKDRVYKALRKWIKVHEDKVISELPEEELLYLTMHMKGSKLRETGPDSKISMVEDFKIIQLAKEFVLAVERETGIYLSDNEDLVFGLVKHLRPAIYRMKMELDFINPLMLEIKAMYPKLFLAIRKCAVMIEEREHVKVPDDEIAYLATHIGAVIQKVDRAIVKKFQVVLACMYGIGASQLLVANIEKNFKSIDIVNVISVMDYKMNRVDFDNMDLVISTIPMDTGSTPCIVVNPLLSNEDIIEVSAFLKNFKPKKRQYLAAGKLRLREKMQQLGAYINIIMAILNQFEFERDVQVHDMSGIIDYASGSIASDRDERDGLIKAFAAREEKGSTILSKKGMILLHCRADISSRVSLKVYQLGEAIDIPCANGTQSINTVVVMVGPAKVDESVLNILSEISRCIITSDFSEMILSGDDRRTEAELHRILDAYFQKMATGS